MHFLVRRGTASNALTTAFPALPGGETLTFLGLPLTAYFWQVSTLLWLL